MRIDRDGSFFLGPSRYSESDSVMLSILAEEDKSFEKQPPKDFDIIWKLMIEQMLKYFFDFFFPCDAGDYDPSHIEFLDTELGMIYPEKDHKPPRRIVDKLVKIFRKDNPKRFSLFHIEVQGFANRHFHHRMFEYYFRLCTKFNCPIITLAIVTGNQRAFVPRYYNSNCGATIEYHYPVYQARHQSEEELLNGLNPFSCVILAAQKALQIPKLTDEQIMETYESLAKVIESRNWPLEPLYLIYGFIHECVSFKDPANISKFKHNLETITKRKNPMGVKEFYQATAREEGRVETRQEFIARFLKDGHYDAEGIAKVLHINVAEIREIERNLKSDVSLSD